MNEAQEPIKDFVKQKIKNSNPKMRGEGHARAHRTRQLINRAEEKLSSVLIQFPGEAVNKAIEVLAGQLKATKQMWDVNAKCLIEIPDERIRQDAALAILAYEWGRPVERKIQATGDFKDFPDLIDRLNSSEAFRESYDSLQKTVEGREVTPSLPAHRDGTE